MDIDPLPSDSPFYILYHGNVQKSASTQVDLLIPNSKSKKSLPPKSTYLQQPVGSSSDEEDEEEEDEEDDEDDEQDYDDEEEEPGDDDVDECEDGDDDVDDCEDGEDDCYSNQSSTSNRRSKRHKVCDCCYCEFFGHGLPPVAPTSKNFNEMRERLRLKLSYRQKTEKCDSRETVTKEDNRDLEDLVDYIEGTGHIEVKKKEKKRRKKDKRKAEVNNNFGDCERRLVNENEMKKDDEKTNKGIQTNTRVKQNEMDVNRTDNKDKDNGDDNDKNSGTKLKINGLDRNGTVDQQETNTKGMKIDVRKCKNGLINERSKNNFENSVINQGSCIDGCNAEELRKENGSKKKRDIKANKKKKKTNKDAVSPDEVFLPKDIDLENGELDEIEKEVEAFKRFCYNSVPRARKDKVNVNLKDIMIKRRVADDK